MRRVNGLAEVAVEQFGSAAFQLMEIADYGEKWDITIPTPKSPAPQSKQIVAYTPEQMVDINVLARVGKVLEDHFCETDGRLYLIGWATRP